MIRFWVGCPIPPGFPIGSLLSDVWIVVTDDATKTKGGTARLDFRLPIAPGPAHLTDPARAHDLLTAKLYIYYALSPTHEGWATAARSIDVQYRILLTFVRWRLSLGIERCADLNLDLYDLYRETLGDRGPRGLVAAEEIAFAYVSQLRTTGGSSRHIAIVGRSFWQSNR